MTDKELKAYQELARQRLGKTEVKQDNTPKQYRFGRDYVPALANKIDFNKQFETAPKHLQDKLRNIAFEARKEVLKSQERRKKQYEHYRVQDARARAREILAQINAKKLDHEQLNDDAC